MVEPRPLPYRLVVLGDWGELGNGNWVRRGSFEGEVGVSTDGLEVVEDMSNGTS